MNNECKLKAVKLRNRTVQCSVQAFIRMIVSGWATTSRPRMSDAAYKRFTQWQVDQHSHWATGEGNCALDWLQKDTEDLCGIVASSSHPSAVHCVLSGPLCDLTNPLLPSAASEHRRETCYRCLQSTYICARPFPSRVKIRWKTVLD